MGLDVVELIMAIEDSFEIAIEDAEAEKIVTVGDIQSFVLARLPSAGKGVCLSSHAFYRLRRKLLTVTNAERSAIRPSTRLEDLFPREGRRAQWSRVDGSLSWDLPALQRPPRIAAMVAATSLLAVPLGYLLFQIGVYSSLIALSMIAVVIASTWTVAALTKPLATEFPWGWTTLGDMARAGLAHNFAKVSSSVRSRTDQEVWLAIQAIVVDQLGVKAEAVVPEARIVDTLGAD